MIEPSTRTHPLVGSLTVDATSAIDGVDRNLKKTKKRGKVKKTLKKRVIRFVDTLLITPDLFKMLMEKSRV
jgi:hypothetical protein